MARKYREMPDIGLLKEILKYEPNTGNFYWKTDRNHSVIIGSIAGSQHPGGYWTIGINGKNYAAHRLAWFYVYGTWPQKHLDHINGNRADNRIENLREATRSQNMQNEKKARSTNSNGFLGVTKHGKKWRATS